MKRPWAMVAGTGYAVPKRVFRNDEFASIGIDTDDAWIRERTGIRERHIAGPGETLTSICTEAAHNAMAAAGVTEFIEIGPGRVLTGLISRIAPSATAFATDAQNAPDGLAVP